MSNNLPKHSSTLRDQREISEVDDRRLRTMIRRERNESLSEASFDGERVDPWDRVSLKELLSKPCSLYYVRFLMSDEDIAELPFNRLRYLLEENDYLDTMISPDQICEYLRIGPPPSCHGSSGITAPFPGGDAPAQPVATEESITAVHAGHPPVSEAALTTWWKQRISDPANQNASLKADQAAASEAFPGKKIARARIETLRGARPLGRKRKIAAK